ncbi:hypothetical protein B0H34DRAFT_794786 [Crassisporium funariophilum]|nr:hypothetical protein B0H34DRAFT_794786 [Crassisporium funariophilum]
MARPISRSKGMAYHDPVYDERLAAAVKDVRSKSLLATKAAKKHNVAYSTLTDRVAGGWTFILDGA